MFAVAVAPLVHGLQRGTTTGPAVPRSAMWMCAAMASPVRPPNESCQLSTVPLSDFVRVPVNDPRAEATSPFGVGISSPATIVATIRIGVAWLRAPAAPAMTSPSTSPTAPASKKSFFTEFPSLRFGIEDRPLHLRLRDARLSGLCRRSLAVLRSPTHSDGGRPPARRWSMFRTSTCGLVLAVAMMETKRRTPTRPSMASRLLSTFESAGLAATATFAGALWVGLALPGLPLLPGVGGGQGSSVAISLNSAVLGVQDGRTFTSSGGVVGRQARLLSLLLPASDPLAKELATKRPGAAPTPGAPMVVVLPAVHTAAPPSDPRVVESSQLASTAYTPAPAPPAPPPPAPDPETPTSPIEASAPPLPDADVASLAEDTPPTDPSSPGNAPGSGTGNGNGNAGGNNPNAGGNHPNAGGANAGGNGNGNGNAGGNNPNAGANAGGGNPNAGGGNPNAGGANAGGNGNANGAGSGAPKGSPKKGR